MMSEYDCKDSVSVFLRDIKKYGFNKISLAWRLQCHFVTKECTEIYITTSVITKCLAFHLRKLISLSN